MPRRFILLIIALLISGGAFFLAQQWVSGQLKSHGVSPTGLDGKPAPPPPKVLVAKVDLPEGSVLTADSLRWQVWPSDDPITSYLTDDTTHLKDYVGVVARVHMYPGQPVMAGAVARRGEAGTMAAVLTPGMRAVTVSVTANSGVAGFITPGDRVDVILTMSLPPLDKDGPARHASETVLSDVRVVGVDQTLIDLRKADKKDPTVPKTATLEVTSKQAEVIAVSADIGIVSLALRSLGQTDRSTGTPTHTWDREAAVGVMSGPPAPAAVVRREPRPQTPFSRVLLVRGDMTSQVMLTPPAPQGGPHP